MAMPRTILKSGRTPRLLKLQQNQGILGRHGGYADRNPIRSGNVRSTHATHNGFALHALLLGSPLRMLL